MAGAAAAVSLAALLVSAACGSGESAVIDAIPTPAATRTPAPGGSASPAAFEYEVQEGDTLGAIAERFGVSVEAIVAANGLSDPSAITVGQVLLITGSDFAPTPAPTPTRAPDNPAGTGYTFPIAGTCLPANDYLMPNAPREYRFGTHEGVDFYTGEGCVDVPEGTPVLAAKAGRVIRADLDYQPLTAEELDELLTRSEGQGYTDAAALDRFRGRQVWVDHGNGIVTRYCHLSRIATGILENTTVQQGQLIAYVGDSGTPESVTAPGTEMHLHFEIRVGVSYLGAGLPPDQARYLYEQVFSS